MTEREVKYMGIKIKYKELEIPDKKDKYGRPQTIKVARQSDAEQDIDEDTGIMRWKNPFLNMIGINIYLKDKEYENITDEKLLDLARKLKI